LESIEYLNNDERKLILKKMGTFDVFSTDVRRIFSYSYFD